MPRKISDKELRRRTDAFAAALKDMLAEMNREPKEFAEDVDRLWSVFHACHMNAQALADSTDALRRHLLTACAGMERAGKNRAHIRQIRRLLHKFASNTHDWDREVREGRIADALGLLSQAILLYRDYGKEPPVKRGGK